MVFRRIEIRAVRAPKVLDGIQASAKYIARLTIDNKPAPVVSFIYFDSSFSGCPFITQVDDFSRALVYRVLVAGSIREALRTAAKQLDSGKEKIKFTARVDLTRRLKFLSPNSPMVQILKESVKPEVFPVPIEHLTNPVNS
ncbi:hypothetical protein [Parasutterella excrementihominis]|uniref:hypothetical protein n=1 Tax=Parasutterella excrementihominis TaxID=487175 RepID=UPI003AEF3A65